MLTRSGLAVVVLAVALAMLGWWWRYEEFVIAAVSLGIVVATSMWSARRRLRARVHRRLGSVRVARGDPIDVHYRLRNDTRVRSGRGTIIDVCDGASTRVPVEPVPSNGVVDLTGSIPTRRRGVFEVGPLSVERVDPAWLAVGTWHDTVTSTVIVHPRIYPLTEPHGEVRTVDSESALRRVATDPLAGFVSMREYVPGDDPRLIHWPTTARLGSLMVREHVEIRRPEFTVVLDTGFASGTADDFEEAVDVAATLSVHAIQSGLDVILRTTSREHLGRPTPLTGEAEVLDLLTPVQRSAPDDLIPMARLLEGGLLHTSMIVVTGPGGPSSGFPSWEHLVVIRIGADAVPAPGIALAAPDARTFVQRWRTWS